MNMKQFKDSHHIADLVQGFEENDGLNQVLRLSNLPLV